MKSDEAEGSHSASVLFPMQGIFMSITKSEAGPLFDIRDICRVRGRGWWHENPRVLSELVHGSLRLAFNNYPGYTEYSYHALSILGVCAGHASNHASIVSLVYAMQCTFIDHDRFVGIIQLIS